MNQAQNCKISQQSGIYLNKPLPSVDIIIPFLDGFQENNLRQTQAPATQVPSLNFFSHNHELFALHIVNDIQVPIACFYIITLIP